MAAKARYFLRFSYFGTHYRGIQRDNSLNVAQDPDTVQGALELALSTLFSRQDSSVHLSLSSRTDAGVHALMNTAHIDLISEEKFSPFHILKHLNFYFDYCKHDIRIQEVIPVSTGFHARLDAISRTYVYRIMIKKDWNLTNIPQFDSKFMYLLKTSSFDFEKAKAAANLLTGTWDFRTFCSDDPPLWKRSKRTLEICTIEKSQSLTPYDQYASNFDYYTLTFKSQGFLYNQVRRLVSAIVACATDKLTEKDLKVMLQVPSRHSWNPSVAKFPSHGLQLVDVAYDPEVIERHRVDNGASEGSEISEEI